MLDAPRRLLEVVEAGPHTVVRFKMTGSAVEENLVELEREVTELVTNCGCRLLAVDLEGVPLIASTLLAFLVWMNKSCVAIELRGPSRALCEQLEVTKLDQILRVVGC